MSSNTQNYYQILGIENSASKDDIKKAFHKLAHKYHPDKAGGDEAKFKEVNEAYQVLSNDKKRAEYDAYGRVFSDGAGPGYSAGGNPFEGFGGSASGWDGQGGVEFDIGDIFSQFFEGRGGQARRGRDISIDLEVSFEESIFGTERKVLLAKRSTCATCTGSGAKPGTNLTTCPTCNGTKRIHETKQSFLGTFSAVRDCETCAGRGRVPAEKCPACHGAGVEKRQEEIVVKIPSGIQDGEMIRMVGMGEAISGGTSGDLYIKMHVKPHSVFRREGLNLVMNLNVKLSDAILGSEYSINTLDGSISVKIPQGVTHGEMLRVKGRGIPLERGRRGDLLIKLSITMPSKLSKKARDLFDQLRSEGI